MADEVRLGENTSCFTAFAANENQAYAGSGQAKRRGLQRVINIDCH